MKLKREHIIPGRIVQVKPGHSLVLDGHLLLSGRSFDLPAGRHVEVLCVPRRVDGINLVRVMVDAIEYEVFYCDILRNCEG